MPSRDETRRNHAPAFKAKVALAAVKGDRTLAEVAEQFDVHPNQVASWKAQLEGGAADVSAPGSGGAATQPAVDVKALHAKIGRADAGERFFRRARSTRRDCWHKAMIDREHDLPITRQAECAWHSGREELHPGQRRAKCRT